MIVYLTISALVALGSYVCARARGRSIVFSLFNGLKWAIVWPLQVIVFVYLKIILTFSDFLNRIGGRKMSLFRNSFDRSNPFDRDKLTEYNKEEDYVEMHKWLDNKIDFNSLSLQDVRTIFNVGLYAWQQINKKNNA